MTQANEDLEFVADLFYNYDLNGLDLRRDYRLVIETVLARGTWEQNLWLFRTYGWDTVKEVFLQDLNGARTLPPDVIALWRGVFLGNSRVVAQHTKESDRWKPTRRVGPGRYPSL